MSELYAAELVDDLFRHSAGQMVSALTRLLGPERLDLAEEVVQDALVKALETWPYRGVPDNPRGWLFTVARNRAMDLLRRDANFASRLADFESFSLQSFALGADDAADADPFADDELAMLFLCCDPALSREAQVALALKTVGGFSVNEIAAAFLAEPTTIAQRIVRAKRTLVEHDVRFELPNRARARERLPALLDVLYLMFTEGYAAHTGENLTRDELCGEAIRLGRLLASNPNTALPATHALLSLLLLQASRLRAREDGAGDLVLLAQQDRKLWDHALIIEGLQHLERSAEGDTITPYHTQAAIAACHAADGEPDWAYVLELYDQLIQLSPTSVVQLNRAIAVAHVYGPQAGIADLVRLTSDPALRRYYLLPAALGYLWREAGRPDEAAEHYRRALALPCNAAERRFLLQRLQECEQACETPLSPRP